MSKEKKKATRKAFRELCLIRDGYCCKLCRIKGRDRQDPQFLLSGLPALDVHHIVSRDIMPNGGYVQENGITVCDECHLKCEIYWQTGVAPEGCAPDDLFVLIGSSFEEAEAASEQLRSD